MQATFAYELLVKPESRRSHLGVVTPPLIALLPRNSLGVQSRSLNRLWLFLYLFCFTL